MVRRAAVAVVAASVSVQLLGSVGSESVQTMTAARASTRTTDTSCWYFKKTERAFTRKINGARGASGDVMLRLDPQLSRVARKHTWEMVRARSLYHTPSSTLASRVTNWVSIGENVGVGDNVDSLHDAFMASPSHRENVLYNAFRHVGVGVVKNDGRMWVTIVFEAKKNPGTTLNMPC